jgi:multiple sugar transport system ATP-binding protein
VVLGIRPENLADAALVNDDSQPRLRAHVELREALGSEVLVHFTTSARPAVTDETRELAEDVGQDRVASADHPALLVGRFSPHTRAVEGDDIDVMIDRRALHFFDPQTGLAIAGA